LPSRKVPRVGLLIGRFQPFHYGHLAAIRFAVEHVDYLYVVVSSAQKNNEFDDPFTASERISMIKDALDGSGLEPSKWMAIPMVDTPSLALWVAALNSIIPRFDVVFSNDPLALSLFRRYGVRVKSVPYFNRKLFSGANVRRRIGEGTAWESLVPVEAARLLKEFGCVRRIRTLSDKFVRPS